MADEPEIFEDAGTSPQPATPDLPLEVLVQRRPRKVYGGMWGPAEIAAVSVGAVALLAAILLYALAVVPSNRNLAKNRSEADRLEVELATAKTKYGQITDTQTEVGKLLASVDDFETRFLPPATNGRDALYQRINGLIAAYGLTNTSGPKYDPLETAEVKDNNQTDEERGREKFRSLFPGTYVTMTVEGSYQSLRRFIRDIETGNEFVIISSIELAPSDTEQKKPETGAPPAPQTAAVQPGVIPIDPTRGNPAGISRANPGAGQPQPATVQKGKTHGEIVALRLEMASYFRRANFAPAAPPAVSQ